MSQTDLTTDGSSLVLLRLLEYLPVTLGSAFTTRVHVEGATKERSLLKTLSIGLATCIASYLFGAVSDRRGIFPEPQLISLRNKVLPTKAKPGKPLYP